MATKAKTETAGPSTEDRAAGEAVAQPSTPDTTPDVATQLAPVPHVDWPPDPTYPFLLSVLRRQVTVRQQDTEAMSRAIAERALGAETIEETLAESGVAPWERNMGITYNVLGVRFAPSAYDEGCPLYALADAASTQDGSVTTLSVGAWSAVYQLLNMWHREQLPATVALASASTKGGMDVYRLVDARV